MTYAYATNTEQIAHSLRGLADRFETLGRMELPETQVRLSIQVCQHGGSQDTRIAAVDALCAGLFGVAAGPNGETLHGTPTFGVTTGCVHADVYTAVQPVRERELAAEVETLRAQCAQLAAQASTQSETSRAGSDA